MSATKVYAVEKRKIIGRVAAQRSLSGEYCGCRITAPTPRRQATGTIIIKRKKIDSGNDCFDSFSKTLIIYLRSDWGWSFCAN